MLQCSLDMREAAREIENAVDVVLKQGYRTGDIWTEGMKKVGTRKMGELVLNEI